MRSSVFVIIFALCVSLLPTSVVLGATEPTKVASFQRGIAQEASAKKAVYPDVEYQAYVMVSSLKVYQKADNTSKQLGKVKKNQLVNVIDFIHYWNEANNNYDIWTQIEYGDSYGWVKGDVLKEKEDPFLYEAFVTASSLTIYQSNSTKSKKKGELKQDRFVKVVKVNKSWSQIRYGRKAMGWVQSKYIRKSTINFDNTLEPTTLELVSSANKAVRLKKRVPEFRTASNIYNGLRQSVSTSEAGSDLQFEHYVRIRDAMYTGYLKKLTIFADIPIVEWEAEYQASYKTNTLPVYNFTITHQNGAIVIVDDISPSTKIIDDVFIQFGQRFATYIKGYSQEEKMHVLYDYIYHQFDYAGVYSKKLINGTAINKTQGSNGLAWLLYHLAKESGLNVTLEKGSMYYITWKTEKGETVTIDVASDIKKQSKHSATRGLTDKKAFLEVEKSILK